MTPITALHHLERNISFEEAAPANRRQIVAALTSVEARSSLFVDSYNRGVVSTWNENHPDSIVPLPDISWSEKLYDIAVKVYYVIAAILIEAVSLVAVAALYPTSAFFSYEDPAPNAQNQKPVVWVHGYLSNPTIWAYLMNQIRGERPQYTTNFPLLSEGIVADAFQLADLVDRALEGKNEREVDLVAHSRGGLVATYYAHIIAPARNVQVNSMTTIASPHEGTGIAFLGVLGNASTEMSLGSEFLVQHRQRLQALVAGGMSYYNVASRNDQIVPFESTVLARGSEQDCLELPHMGHIGPVLSPAVGEFIRGKLLEAH